MVICLVVCPLELAQYLVLIGYHLKKFRELQSEYNLVNDHIMQVLEWSIQDRKRSFIMHVTLNVDNI